MYVVPFPPTGEKWQLSVDGGAQPAWRRDSGELYFVSLDGTLMASSIARSARFAASRPAPLFKTPIRTVSQQIEQYAAAPDGKRFLFAPFIGDETPSITVVTNWPSLLQATGARQ